MGGPRLTPEQIELASTVYARTENVSEAARAIGVNESTLRAFFDRERIARNREAHARACEAGLQEGLAFLMDVARECHGVLTRRIPVGSGLEASDFASLGRTVNQALATVAALAKRDEERRLARGQRTRLRGEVAKLTAEVALLEREVKKGGGGTPAVIGPGDPRWADLQREVFGSPRHARG